MSWTLRSAYPVLAIASIFGLVIFAVDTGTPALMNRLTILEAERLSVHWLNALSEELKLPGQPAPLESHAHNLIDKVIPPSPGHFHDTAFKGSLSLQEFESEHHLHEILGYAICSVDKHCMIFGGAPIESDLQLSEVASVFGNVLKNKEIEAIFSGGAADNGDRVVSVMVPLLRNSKLQAVAIVDLKRSAFERSLYEAIQRAGTILTSLISFISIGIILVFFYLDKRRNTAELEADFLTFHDILTELPNRRHFNHVLEKWFDEAAIKKNRFAVFCIDVDNFKDINDIFGHPVGDQLLIEIGQNLRLAAGDEAFVAHLSGDEFAVLYRKFDRDTDLSSVVNAILAAQRKSIAIHGYEIGASVSIGIAEYPKDGENPQTVLKHADLALSQAKAKGRGSFEFFRQELELEIQRKHLLRRELQAAINNDQLEMHYQPQVDIKTGTVTGFEALLRWTHELNGPISPAEFIPIAEQNGLIVDLSYWTLKTACCEAANWPENYSVAVNLSPVMFADEDLVSRIRDILQKTGLASQRLEIEITENLLLGNAEGINHRLTALRQLGVGIAMDDFGTGYSSLSYLTRIPVTKIKIDQSFIRQLSSSATADSIINAVVGIGKSLDVTVVAEGVENVDQLRQLNSAGCNVIQGFLFGKPSLNPFDYASLNVLRSRLSMVASGESETLLQTRSQNFS